MNTTIEMERDLERARRRSAAREAMSPTTRENAQRWGLDCPCITPWADGDTRRELGLVLTVSPDVCAVRGCWYCAGSPGKRVSAESIEATFRGEIAMEARPAKRIERNTLRPSRAMDSRFPRPRHTAQPGVTWGDALISLDHLDTHVGLLTLLLGVDEAIAEVDRQWRADIDTLRAWRQRAW